MKKEDQKPKTCRFCNSSKLISFCNLGSTPLANRYLNPSELNKEERFYPLHAYVCQKCFLVQLGEIVTPQELFQDYTYFSSYSKKWLEHCQLYAEQIIERMQLNSSHLVIELASNDGYLLQYFKKRNIPILGIEPAKNVAKIARDRGIPTMVDFFGSNVALHINKKANLIIANNVIAHVPLLKDFVQGIKLLLLPNGIATIEFPHLLQLMNQNQFDTIYHEHFSYFSLHTIKKVFELYKLDIFDVEELSTHGGSLRIFVKHKEDRTKIISESVGRIIEKEKKASLTDIKGYRFFFKRVMKIREEFRNFLLDCQEKKQKICGYGAPAKGNTLLNFSKIDRTLLPLTVDISPHKQNKFLPGSHIPIFSPERIFDMRPDYILILPWNLRNEIGDQLIDVRRWGAKFVVAIPKIEIF